MQVKNKVQKKTLKNIKKVKNTQTKIIKKQF